MLVFEAKVLPSMNLEIKAILMFSLILLGFASFGCKSILSDQTKLIVAVANNKTADIETLLLSKNVDINSLNGEAGPFLCIAGYLGHNETIEILLKHGADIDIRDDKGTTPLMNAVIGQKESTVNLLLERGADISPVMLKDNREPSNMDALSLAKMRPNKEIIELLQMAQDNAEK